MKYIGIGIAVIAVVIGLWMFFHHQSQKLSKEDVKQRVMATESIIAESLLLTQEAQQHKVTPQFLYTHAQALKDQLNNINQSFNSPAESYVTQQVKQNKKILSQSEKELQVLAAEKSIQQVHNHLNMLLIQAKQLDKTL